VAEKSVEGSILSANGMKIALALRGENKLKVWDVWGKRKEVKQPSFMNAVTIR
jgi:cell division cycle protein 20 (cofactor of APC complex)